MLSRGLNLSQNLWPTLSKSLAVAARLFSISANTHTRRNRRGNDGLGQEFAEDELDNLDALEDYINQGGTTRSQSDGRYFESDTKEKIRRQLLQEQRKVKNKILERKHFKPAREVNLLTWRAKEQIRHLHGTSPEEWTPQQLAQTFPVSLQGVLHTVNSTYRPRTEEERQNHDKRVTAHWKQLKKTLATGEDQTSKFKHITDTGKLPLMINAGGSFSLPRPRKDERNWPMKLIKGQRAMGRFESIVAGSELVKADEEKERKKKVQLRIEGEKLLRDISGVESEQTKSKVNGYLESSSHDKR